MGTPRFVGALTVALLLVAGLAGCGDDDSPHSLDKDEQKAAAALALEFQGHNPTDFARDAGICLGKRLVSDLGTAKLVDGGLLNDDLTVNTTREGIADRLVAQGYADAIISCQDVRGEIESRRSFYPDATDADIDTYVDCVQAIDPRVLRKAIVSAALKDEDQALATDYLEQTSACTEHLGPPKRR